MRYRINLLPDHHRVTFQFVLINLINKIILALAIGVLLLVAADVFAADIRPVNGLDAQATGSVVPAKTLSSGGMAVGLGVHSAQSPVPNRVLKDSQQDVIAEQINQVSALFAFGLSDILSLHLGVHGTQENLNEPYRAAVNQENASGFAGATVMTKLSVFSHRGINLSLAPFLESGAGDAAAGSLSRSSTVKGGWMILAGWQKRRLGSVDLNIGYRYRNPEVLGDLSLRNELVAQAAAKAYIMRGFGVMAGAQGRRIMVAAAETPNDGGKKTYEPIEAGEMQAGLVMDIDTLSLAAFGGQKIKGAGLGQGDRHVGISLAYVFGEQPRGVAGRRKIANARKDHGASTTDDDTAAPVPTKDPNGIYDFDGALIDPYDDFDKQFGETDDFKAVRESIRREQERQKQSPLSEDVRVENELRQIKDAEAKQEAAEKARQEAELRDRRAQGRAARSAQAEELRRLREEVQQDVKQNIRDISDDDLRWEGLEERE